MQHRIVISLLAVFAAVFIWSAILPHDYFTWFLEVVPAIMGCVILTVTYRRFQLSTMLYCVILLHAVVLMVGGHYTYAEVPIGDWIRDHFHLARNHYDRVGHFMQGFVPTMIAREVLWRSRVVQRPGWLGFLAFSAAMMITAVYELFEYGVAVSTGSAADAFLGGQGDPWDTQNDMLMCMIGSLTATLGMSHWHDRVMRKLEGKCA